MGDWKESSDLILRGFGEEESVTRYVPYGIYMEPKRWDEHPRERNYNKETGEWICEFGVNTSAYDWMAWEDEILPYCMESIQHYESCAEGPGDNTTLFEYINGKKEPIGILDGNEVFHSKEELQDK